MELIQRYTTLLKSFTSSAVTFATADNSISATGIGTAFATEGVQFIVSGAAQAGNNTTFTVASVSSANKIIVTETVTAESAGATVTANQYFVDEWKKCNMWNYISGIVDASQNCTVYIDQTNDMSHYYTTTINVLADVPKGYEIKTIGNYCRQRILNGGTTQTDFSSVVNGTAR